MHANRKNAHEKWHFDVNTHLRLGATLHYFEPLVGKKLTQSYYVEQNM